MKFSPDHSPQLATMLVELDSILDTRQGTLAKFGTEAYVKALTHGYYSRPSDHFVGIDPKEYFRLYRERDAVTLSMSTITHCVSVLKDFVKRVNIISASSPINKRPRIEVNTYPYNPPDKVLELLKKGLGVLINDSFDIGFVRYSPKDLHYDLVKFTYDHMVMYDIGPWLEAQAEDWKRRNRGLPDVTVITPALYHTQNYDEVTEDVGNVADEVARTLSPLVNVLQMPIPMFCSVYNPFLEPDKEPFSPEPEGPEENKD